MSLEASAAARVRRLRASLAWLWSVAWIGGIAVFALVSVRLSARLHVQDLDSEIALWATSTYGLTWFDGRGRLRDHVFRDELAVADDPPDIWIVESAPTPIVHLEPADPDFEPTDLAAVAGKVHASGEAVIENGTDAHGHPYRLHAIPTFEEHDVERVKAAIIVLGDPTPGRRAQQSFVARIVSLAGVLGGLGLFVGFALARKATRPILDSLARSERFLAATAHELRTPVAAMRGVSESALAGDESAERALERLSPLLRRTGRVVDELLLFSRLDAGSAELERQSVRLDLLVETCVPDGADVELDAPEVVADADPRLVEVAVRNLIANALEHAGGAVRVAVTASGVVVEDGGSGFPASVLQPPERPFAFADSRGGVGLGLAIARLVAELHGGGLALENLPEGGARATLHLADRAVS